MVFRQLRITWLAILPLAVLPLASGACGEEAESSVSVAMQLDGDTCGAGPDELVLTCPSTAVVQVRGLDFEPISSACVHLDPGRLSDMADVMGELVILGNLPPSIPLSIEFAIHSGTREPCSTDTVSTGAFLFGNSMSVILDELESDLILPLECVHGDGSVEGAFCDECDASLNQCLFSQGLDSCDSLFFDCETDCSNGPDEPGCFDTCIALSSFCFDTPDGISLSCFEQNECVLGCGDQDPICLQACFDAQDKCATYDAQLTQCRQSHTQCLSECGEATSCLGFSF
jgi:hypothetical protein